MPKNKESLINSPRYRAYCASQGAEDVESQYALDAARNPDLPRLRFIMWVQAEMDLWCRETGKFRLTMTKEDQESFTQWLTHKHSPDNEP